MFGSARQAAHDMRDSAWLAAREAMHMSLEAGACGRAWHAAREHVARGAVCGMQHVARGAVCGMQHMAREAVHVSLEAGMHHSVTVCGSAWHMAREAVDMSLETVAVHVACST
eukprot:1159810-Pelagomonas_calceolata.AAC.16